MYSEDGVEDVEGKRECKGDKDGRDFWSKVSSKIYMSVRMYTVNYFTHLGYLMCKYNIDVLIPKGVQTMHNLVIYRLRKNFKVLILFDKNL